MIFVIALFGNSETLFGAPGTQAALINSPDLPHIRTGFKSGDGVVHGIQFQFHAVELENVFDDTNII